MQCSDCQRRGSSVANVASVSSSVASTSAETASSLPSTPSPITVSPGSPTPPASPTWKPPSDASDAPLLWPTPPPSSCNGAGTSTTSTWSSRQLCLDNIDLSLPLTSTLLKHAKLSGLSHRRLFGLDQPVSPRLHLFISVFIIISIFILIPFFSFSNLSIFHLASSILKFCQVLSTPLKTICFVLFCSVLLSCVFKHL